MRVLLDTNILIHREANRLFNEDIGVLFRWFDKLHYEKCIHPLSLEEIRKYKDEKTVRIIEGKLKNYHQLRTIAPETVPVVQIREKYDRNDNDSIDTSLLNEVYAGRVNFFITEDRKIHAKAKALGVHDFVFSIDDFLEKVSSENPALADYKTLAVKKEYFGNIQLNAPFFDSFRADYAGFDRWFNSKADEIAYVCTSDEGEILAFLYVKVEGLGENYRDIVPIFSCKKRLKIGTLKVVSNGYKLGERFLKVVFDNAMRYRVDEIYVTLFNKTEEHERLIGLLGDWGFNYHGRKLTETGDESVYVKDFVPTPNALYPKLTYPFINRKSRFFIVPIYPEYHTELFPDSILNTESPTNFTENAPHRNAIQKVYVSRSIFRSLNPGNIVVFYYAASKSQGNAIHKSVVTTIGIIENVYTGIQSCNDFIRLCRKRSVFTDDELKRHWDWNDRSRPFVVNFLYLYSLPKRPNLKSLIEIGVIASVSSAPRGFVEINSEQFNSILKASDTDESFIVDKA